MEPRHWHLANANATSGACGSSQTKHRCHPITFPDFCWYSLAHRERQAKCAPLLQAHPLCTILEVAALPPQIPQNPSSHPRALMTSLAARFALPSAWHVSHPPILAILLQSSLWVAQWPLWHACEQYQIRHREHLLLPSLPQAAQFVGATATSLLLSAAGALPLAGVHLFALVRVAPLASTRACCWAPLPMAPLPMVVCDAFGGEGEKWGCPSVLPAAIS